MSSPAPSNAKFVILSGAIIVTSAVGLACLWPVALAYGRWQSAQLAEEGSHAIGPEAVTDYRLAVKLNPANTDAHFGLAQTSLAINQPEIALTELDLAGKGPATLRLKVRTLLELGRNTEAAAAANELSADPTATVNDLLLACLAQVTASQPAACDTAKARLSSSEALGRVSRAQAGQLPLAAELLATGLPQSAQRILLKLPPSLSRNLMLGRLNYDLGTAANLAQAVSDLTESLQFDPSSIEAHKLLADTYRAQGNTIAAQLQNAQATKLIAGRP